MPILTSTVRYWPSDVLHQHTKVNIFALLQVYQRLTEELWKRGVERTPAQVMSQCKQQRLKYNHTRIQQQVSGQASEPLPYQDLLDLIFIGRPAANLHPNGVDLTFSSGPGEQSEVETHNKYAT